MGGVVEVAGSRGSTARTRGWCAGFRCSEARAVRRTAARSCTHRGTAPGADLLEPPEPGQHLGAELHTARALQAEPRCGSSWISPWRRNFRQLSSARIRSALEKKTEYYYYFTKRKQAFTPLFHLYIYPFYKLTETFKKKKDNNRWQVPRWGVMKSLCSSAVSLWRRQKLCRPALLSSFTQPLYI